MASVGEVIKNKLDQARHQLIDRNLRNKLVNCALTSKRSRQIRVVDELADEIFKTLWLDRREMSFAPGRGVREEEGEVGDRDYAIWTPPETDSVDDEGVAQRHRDSSLQTQLTAEGLQKRLTALYYEATETEEEQGVNILYLALGFVKWFEAEHSEVERFAPLVLIPVELTRKGARERFQLKARDEDLYTNISFKVWLAEQHSIELPDLPDSEEWLPSAYFDAVRAAIRKAKRWEVREEVLLGFFSFNKFLLWRDLDPAHWPDPGQLLGHGILSRLLAPQEEHGEPESPLFPEDARIDERVKAADLNAILDADSSQTVAIQTAVGGRNLVVQGPPGTGKSQTIANIIAAAVHQGKTVLFVAEKLAALQVVHDRLQKAGLGALCFELHSRSASKQQVHAQLREALEAARPATPRPELCEELDQVTSALWAHSDRMHRPLAPSGHTPFEILGKICRLRDRNVPIPDFEVQGAETWSRRQIESFLKEVEAGAQRLRVAGVAARHPWRGCDREILNPLDAQRLAGLARVLAASHEALPALLHTLWPLVRPREEASLALVPFSTLPRIVRALQLAAERPQESLELLCHPRWATDREALGQIAALAQELAEIERALEPVFVEAAWEHDWTVERAALAAGGESVWRRLGSAYRAAVRTYRGVCRSPPPKQPAERLAALDQLIHGRALRVKLQAFGATCAGDLGSIWPSLPGGHARLEALVQWLGAVAELEPALSVRQTRLLGSEAPAQWANRLAEAIEAVAKALEALVRFVRLTDAEFMGEPAVLRCSLGRLFERAQAWRSAPERFNEWPPARAFLARLRETTGEAFTGRVESGEIPPGELAERVHLALCEQLWKRMCAQDPALEGADGRELDRLVESFRSLDQARVKAAALEAARRHFDQKPTGAAGQMGVIRQELNKSRRLLPVRRLVDHAGSAIQALKPVFLMSPLSVAQYLAPGRLTFDLLLIDEASQVRPEDALGAVARARQIVVVGDAKQLPPTSFFNRLADEGEEGTEETVADGSPAIGAMESILSLCDATLSNRAMLRWHYRSLHPALIAVSNYSFYDNKLLLPPAVTLGQRGGGLGLFFHPAPEGGYERGQGATNVAEADLVAEAVCAFARQHPEKSLGVGTFSAAQRDVIRDRIDARRREAPELEPFFANSRPAPFFVKNLESIQGDERDVIFLSVGYGRDRHGRLTQSFGPINGNGGERRLNVLISRARERCEVFTSLTAEDIDTSSGRPGVVALKQFLQFAQKGFIDVPQVTERPFDSDFEESVADFLTTRGYHVHAQVGMAGFFIDIGVLAPESASRYLLGVECDGATYHSSRSARDRDRIRQQILEQRGWRLHRIWSTDWFTRRAREEERMLEALERAKRGESGPAEKAKGGADGRDVAVAKAARAPAEKTEPVDRRAVVGEAGSSVSPRSRVVYVEARFTVKSGLPPHEAPNKVREAAQRIVEIEGPIHEEEVARRVATAWGLNRTGSRIQEATRRALRGLAKTGVVREEGTFWSPAGATEVAVRDRSETASITLRKAEYLPPAEIAAAAVAVVRECVRVEEGELVVEIARRLGFQRTGQELQEVIARVVQGEEGRRLQADGGALTLRVSPG
ncbi:MAG: DUF3320 domain-containing protein [Steroidobacteraceae bacterium]